MSRIASALLAGVLLTACAPKGPRFVGPGHDFDWPVESPDAPAYQTFLRAQRLSNEGDLDGAIAWLNKGIRIDGRAAYLHGALATEYAKKNDLAAAEVSAQTAVGLDPDFRDAHFLLARIYTIRGEWEKAEPALKRVVALDGTEANEGSIALAALYTESKRPGQAVEILNGLIARDPNDLLARYYLGRVLTEMDRMEEALAMYRSASAINPSFTAPMKAVGLIHEFLGEVPKAIEAFRSVLEIEPDNTDVRNHLGQLFLEQGDLDAALAEYRTVAADSPEDVDARLRIGLIQLRKEDLAGADESFTRLLDDAPDLHEVRYYLAVIRERRGRGDEAIRLLEKIPQEAPVFVESRLALAFLHEQRGEPRKAERVLRRALTARKDASDVRAALASGLVGQKRFEEAIALLQEGLKAQPKDETLWMALAETYEKAGDFPRTEESLRKVIELNPDNASALNYLGYSFAERGRNLAEAERLIGRALEIRPNDGYITDSLGWVYYQQGRCREAVGKLEEAMKLTPEEPVILEHYGDALLKCGEPVRARGAFERARSLFKGAEEKERVEGKIRNLPRP